MAAPSSSAPLTSIVPAQLGFLAIFNPTLGATDETLDDQIVYYASMNTQTQTLSRRRNRSKAKPTDNLSQEERNERLRQIGLAQGMVEFGRGFSDGRPVDAIETEKTRVVLHELEPNWWILGSIDLTKIPLPPRLGSSSKDNAAENVEYSSREVKPAALLMQDLLRAHSIFLLHHAASLSELFVRSRRSKFVTMLTRYWDLFLSTWNVMLHGNPAASVFGGIKIAASGELGVGVGEEDRGSGEREVLEGFVGRVEGLVDLFVSKFGEASPDERAKDEDSGVPEWLGTGEEPGSEDGAIFLGVGALSRNSTRDITQWMEDLYTWGEGAYGVKDSPTASKIRAKRIRALSKALPNALSLEKGIAAESTPGANATSSNPAADDADATAKGPSKNNFVDYLKMGYGTHWTLAGSGNSNKEQETSTEGADAGKQQRRAESRSRRSTQASADVGHYLIGLKGDVEDTISDTSDSEGQSDGSVDRNSRTLLRTVTVELESKVEVRPEAGITRDLGSQETGLKGSGWPTDSEGKPQFDSQDRNKTNKMRVVVYVCRPFIYTFLFRNRTDSLAWDSLYRSLHYQLAPLRKPLASSTAYRPEKPDAGPRTGAGTASSHIFDLVWDPKALTVHSTIPNIPDPAAYNVPGTDRPLWSRVEALNTHMQILNTYVTTRSENLDLERTCKTSRGWWVVWTRILEAKESSAAPGTDSSIGPSSSMPGLAKDDSQGSSDTDQAGTLGVYEGASTQGSATLGGSSRRGRRRRRRREPAPPRALKEIFLIRRAGEHGQGALRGVSEGGGGTGAGGGTGWADSASRLAQGIGVDTRKYIDGLLSLGL